MSYGSRCSACKYLRRKCPPDCSLAPYFPSNKPQRFASVHRIYGASNVVKMLQKIENHDLRVQAANSLHFEAQRRIEDPVYGCAGMISQLHQQIQWAETELAKVQAEITLKRSATISALIEAIHSDFSIEDEHNQVNPPTNQIQNTDPSAAGPSRAQQNALNLEQSLGLQLHGIEQALLSPVGNLFPFASEGYFSRLEIPNQQQRIEDLIYPHQIMNFENLHDQEVDWDEFMDAMLQDDIGSEWKE